jgi:hypothetical protein
VQEILQFLIELVLQAFLELIFDHVFRHVGVDRRVVRIAVYSLFGAVVGGCSLAVISGHLIASAPLRYVALFVVPSIVGLAMHGYGCRREKRGADAFGLESFWPSWGFAFSFSLVRLLLAR